MFDISPLFNDVMIFPNYAAISPIYISTGTLSELTVVAILTFLKTNAEKYIQIRLVVSNT